MSIPKPLTVNDDRHGTPRGYALGCRDRCCTSAAAIDRRRTRIKAREKGLAPDDPRHGSINAYTNWGCRCERCRAASTKQIQQYRENLFRPA